MYTLNKSYINTKKIKHLQCKKCSSVVNFHGRAYPAEPQPLPSSRAFTRFTFWIIFFFPYLFFSPLTVHALTQNTMRNLEPLGKKKCCTRVRGVVVGNSTKLKLTSSLILFKQ